MRHERAERKRAHAQNAVELRALYEDKWVAPVPPEIFNLADDGQAPLKKATVEDMAESSSTADPAVHPNKDEGANINATDVEDLIELQLAGEQVRMPPGANHADARGAEHESAASTSRPKRARLAMPECASNVGSTPSIASTEALPIPPPIRLNPAPAHVAVFQFGRNHDLRESGPVVWCRLCGRFGEERVQEGRGIGGDCVGWERRAHSQLRLLRSGRHPRTEAPLPPEYPYRR